MSFWERMGDLSAQSDVMRGRALLRRRREAARGEVERLAAAAAELGVQRVVLFGSAARGEMGLTSDADLLVVWDTPLDFVARTAELHHRLQPRGAEDLLVYTPREMERIANTPFAGRALVGGRVLYEA